MIKNQRFCKFCVLLKNKGDVFKINTQNDIIKDIEFYTFQNYTNSEIWDIWTSIQLDVDVEKIIFSIALEIDDESIDFQELQVMVKDYLLNLKIQLLFP